MDASETTTIPVALATTLRSRRRSSGVRQGTRLANRGLPAQSSRRSTTYGTLRRRASVRAARWPLCGGPDDTITSGLPSSSSGRCATARDQPIQRSGRASALANDRAASHRTRPPRRCLRLSTARFAAAPTALKGPRTRTIRAADTWSRRAGSSVSEGGSSEHTTVMSQPSRERYFTSFVTRRTPPPPRGGNSAAISRRRRPGTARGYRPVDVEDHRIEHVA